jgi:hypothetical protein
MSSALTRAAHIGAGHADFLKELVEAPVRDEFVTEAPKQLDDALGSMPTDVRCSPGRLGRALVMTSLACQYRAYKLGEGELQAPKSLPPPQDHAQKKTAHAAEQDRPDILTRRAAWFEGQLDLDPASLLFIDETWAATNMARRHGRAPRGQRLRVGVPHGHWKTTTFVAGLRLDGIAAPFVLDGPINRTAFETYVERVLVPEMDRAGGAAHGSTRAEMSAATRKI